MTLSEFKAWFEGFSEIMEGPPNEKQWDRIKARVAEINGATVTERVFVDRYIEPYRRYWPNVPYWASSSGPLVGQQVSNVLGAAVSAAKAINAEFESHVAMLDLGRAEYKAAFDA